MLCVCAEVSCSDINSLSKDLFTFFDAIFSCSVGILFVPTPWQQRLCRSMGHLLTNKEKSFGNMLLTNKPVCCKHWNLVQAHGLFLACCLEVRQEHKKLLPSCTESTSFFTPPRIRTTTLTSSKLHKNNQDTAGRTADQTAIPFH